MRVSLADRDGFFRGSVECHDARQATIMRSTDADADAVTVNYEEYTDAAGEVWNLMRLRFRPMDSEYVERFVDVDSGQVYLERP